MGLVGRDPCERRKMLDYAGLSEFPGWPPPQCMLQCIPCGTPNNFKISARSGSIESGPECSGVGSNILARIDSNSSLGTGGVFSLIIRIKIPSAVRVGVGSSKPSGAPTSFTDLSTARRLSASLPPSTRILRWLINVATKVALLASRLLSSFARSCIARARKFICKAKVCRSASLAFSASTSLSFVAMVSRRARRSCSALINRPSFSSIDLTMPPSMASVYLVNSPFRALTRFALSCSPLFFFIWFSFGNEPNKVYYIF